MVYLQILIIVYFLAVMRFHATNNHQSTLRKTQKFEGPIYSSAEVRNHIKLVFCGPTAP